MTNAFRFTAESIIGREKTGWLHIGGLAALVMGLIVLHGCGTPATGRGWGRDATITPGWKKVGRSAWGAVTSPAVWLPATGALVLQIQDLDGRISEWAVARHPVFGSRSNALEKSNSLADIAAGAYLVTAVAAPSGDQPHEWLLYKARGLAVGAATIGMTKLATSSLKDVTHRLRPDKTDYSSLPSQHASNAAALTLLSMRNLEAGPMPLKLRWGANTVLCMVALGTGWARVEAQKHYPSDVLAGMALGNFMAAFIYDAFMGLEPPWRIGPAVTIGPGTIFVGVRAAF